MTEKDNDRYKSLGKSIAIYKKTNSKNWYAWFPNPDRTQKDVRKTLDVSDEAQARIKAVELRSEYQTAFKLGFNISNPYRLFSDVANGCFKDIWENNFIKKSSKTKPFKYKNKTRNFSDNNKRTLAFIESEIIPKIGKKAFLGVNTEDLRIAITKDSDPEQVAKSTIAFRLSVLTKLYDFAGQKSVIKKAERPDFPKIETRMKKRRKHFSDTQIEKLNTIIDTYISESKSGDKQQFQNRQMFKYYFNFNIYVGARIGIEISENTFSDLTKDKVNDVEYFQLHIYQGKTQNYSEDRQSVISRPAESYLQEICLWKFGLNLDQTIEQYPQRKLFSRPCDNKIPDFVYLWTRIRELAIEQGVIPVKDKGLYTLYSTRHKYATDLLKKHMRDKDFSINALSKQLGTSEKMLNEVYQHTSATNIADTFYTAFDNEEQKAEYQNKELPIESYNEYVNYFNFDQIPADLEGFERLRETAKIIEAKYSINSGDAADLNNLMMLIINSNNASDQEKDIVADLMLDNFVVIKFKSDIDKILYLFNRYHNYYFKENFNGSVSQLKRLDEVFENDIYFQMCDSYAEIIAICNVLRDRHNDNELSDLMSNDTMITDHVNSYRKENYNEALLVDFEFCRKEIQQIEVNNDVRIYDKLTAIDALIKVPERVLVAGFIENCEKLEALQIKLEELENHANIVCSGKKVTLNDCEFLIAEYKEANLLADLDESSNISYLALTQYVELKEEIEALTAALGVLDNTKTDNVVKLSFVKK
jgi:integrase